MMLQPGDCILFSGKSFVSRGIQWFTGSKWNHVAMYVGGGDRFVIEATAAGVEKNKLMSILHCDFICVRRIPNLTVEDAEQMKAKAYSLIYDDYDFKQIALMAIYFGLRKLGFTWSALVRNSKNSMICSELYAVCALTIPLSFHHKIKLVTPDTLATTSELTTVYDGTCADFVDELNRYK